MNPWMPYLAGNFPLWFYGIYFIIIDCVEVMISPCMQFLVIYNILSPFLLFSYLWLCFFFFSVQLVFVVILCAPKTLLNYLYF